MSSKSTTFGIGCVRKAWQCMWCLLCFAGQAWAGDAHITRDAGPNDVEVVVDEATPQQILRTLAAHFGFVVDGAAEVGTSMRFSGHLQGPLDRILVRILREQGHVIVRSAESRSGISKVILLAPKRATPVVAATAPTGATQEPTGGGHPVAPPPPSGPAGGASAPTAPVAHTDPTLRQLEEIGRQLIGVDPSRPIDAGIQAPGGATGAMPSSPGAGDGTADTQGLTQRAVANVQSLVSSLRAVCLGRSCAP